MKYCHICQTVLTIRPGEHKWNFANRKTCSEECRSKLRAKQSNRKIKKGRYAFRIHEAIKDDDR